MAKPHRIGGPLAGAMRGARPLHVLPFAFTLAACTFSIPGLDEEAPGAPKTRLDSGTMPDAGTPGDASESPDLTLGDPCQPPGPLPIGVHAATCTISQPPLVDGNLSDWPDALFMAYVSHSQSALVSGSWGSSQSDNDTELSATFAVRWDLHALYLAIKVNDDWRGTLATSFTQADAVELYFDGEHDRSDDYGADDLELVVRPGNEARAYRDGNAIDVPGAITFRTSDSGKSAGWNAEIAIPWTVLGPRAAAAGRVLGFTVQLDDNDGLLTRERTLVWRHGHPADCAGCGSACMPWCNTRAFDALALGGR